MTRLAPTGALWHKVGACTAFWGARSFGERRMSGAEGGSRTHTGVTPMDFESIASAIPPLRLVGCSRIWLADHLDRSGSMRTADYLY